MAHDFASGGAGGAPRGGASNKAIVEDILRASECGYPVAKTMVERYKKELSARLGCGSSGGRGHKQDIKYFSRTKPLNECDEKELNTIAFNAGIVICTASSCSDNTGNVGEKRKGGRNSSRVWMKWADYAVQTNEQNEGNVPQCPLQYNQEQALWLQETWKCPRCDPGVQVTEGAGAGARASAGAGAGAGAGVAPLSRATTLKRKESQWLHQDDIFYNLVLVPGTRYFAVKKVDTSLSAQEIGAGAFVGTHNTAPVHVYLKFLGEVTDVNSVKISDLQCTCANKCAAHVPKPSLQHDEGHCFQCEAVLQAMKHPRLQLCWMPSNKVETAPKVFQLPWAQSYTFSVQRDERDDHQTRRVFVNLVTSGKEAGNWLCGSCIQNASAFRSCQDVQLCKKYLQDRGVDVLALEEGFKAAREEKLAKTNGSTAPQALGCLEGPFPCRPDTTMGLYENRSRNYFMGIGKLSLTEQKRQDASTAVGCNNEPLKCVANKMVLWLVDGKAEVTFENFVCTCGNINQN